MQLGHWTNINDNSDIYGAFFGISNVSRHGMMPALMVMESHQFYPDSQTSPGV